MHWLTFGIVLIVALIYAVIGGVIFHFVETGHEQQTRESAHQRLAKFLDDRPCLNLSTIDALSKLFDKAKAAGVQAIPETNNLTYYTNWDLASSIFLSFQVIGSVGYGNASPQTIGGRIFCILFALIGIPLLLITGLGIAYQMINGAERLRKCCIRNAGAKDAVKVHVVRSLILLVVIIILFILIPAAILTAMEKEWTYGDAIFFCFTSVLTLGFGDFVPGSDWTNDLRNLFRLGVGFWLILSLFAFAGLSSSIAVAVTSSREMQEDLPDDAPHISLPHAPSLTLRKKSRDHVAAYLPPEARTPRMFVDAFPVRFSNPNPDPYTVNRIPLYNVHVAQGDVTHVTVR